MSKLIYTGKELSQHNPELVDEWDYDKNYPVTPDDVSYGSAEKYWWKCKKCGKSYEASPSNRTYRKTACPYCAAKDRGISQKATYAERNNLAKKYPELLKDWDYDKNTKKPNEYSCGSNETVWWKCHKCGHEWQTTPNRRTGKNGTGCPVCAYKSAAKKNSLNAAKTNSFVKNYPDIAKEWDYEKNVGLDINEYSSKSNKRVWWKCSFCGNSWQTTINERASGRGCPNCTLAGTSFSEQTVLYYVKKIYPDAMSRYKELGMELDVFIPDIKTAVEYDGVYYHNSSHALEKENKKDELCKEHNIRLIRIRDSRLPDTKNSIRITCTDTGGKHLNKAIKSLLDLLAPGNNIIVDVDKDGIGIKAKYRESIKENCIANVKPELLEEWNYEKNLHINPETVSSGSDIKYWWKCKKCGYEWQATPYTRTLGRGCHCCAGLVVVPGINDFASQHPDLLKEWDYEKNTVSPDKVSCGSNKKVWWKCQKCGNSWQAAPYTRTKLGSGCPYCFGRLPIKGKTDLASQKPELLKDWDYEKNEISPDDICCGSEKKVWWKCHICGYEWQASPSLRNAGGGCTKCLRKKAGKKKSLEAAKTNSLSGKYPQISEEWDYEKNDTSPDKVSCGSNKRVWWICHKCGYGWQATPNTRTSGCGCPCCAGRVVVPGINDLASKKPELLKDWNYEKNTVSPKEVTCGSHKKVWWKCHKCGYEWQTTPHNRTGNNRTGCPKCSRTHRSETQK